MNKLKKIVAKAMNKRASLTKNAAPLYYPNESKTFEEEKGKIKVTIKRVDDHNSILVNIQIEPEDPRKKIFSFDGIIRPVLNEQKGWGDYNDINEYLKDTMIYEDKEDFKGYGNYIGNTIRELIEIVDGIPALNKKAQKNKANKLASIISKEILKSAKYTYIPPKSRDLIEEWEILYLDGDSDYFESWDETEENFNKNKDRVEKIIHRVYEKIEGQEQPEEIQVDIEYERVEDINEEANKKNKLSKKAEETKYGVEYRDMNKGIHNLIITDTKEKATEILNLLKQIEQIEHSDSETNENMDNSYFTWEIINDLAQDSIEVDYRQTERSGGNYKGIEIINYDENKPDIWG